MDRDDRDSSMSDEVRRLTTEVDAKRERRIVAHVGAAPGSGWAGVKIALLLGFIAFVVIFGIKYHAFDLAMEFAGVAPSPAAPTKVRAATTIDPAKKFADDNNLDTIARENLIQNLPNDGKMAPPPPPPPKPVELADAGPDTPAPTPAAASRREQPPGIIGVRVPLGTVDIEVENYWVDEGGADAKSYAGLRVNIINVSGSEITVPTVDAVLLDGQKREYKHSKMVSPGSGTKVNPLVKSVAMWSYEVPPEAQMYCAKFTFKQGRNAFTAYVKLTERTPENQDLTDSREYMPAQRELELFASPRAPLAYQYFDARAELDKISADLDQMKPALKKAENRRNASERALKKAEDTLASRKTDFDNANSDLGRNATPPHTQHDLRRWEIARRGLAEARANADANLQKATDDLKTRTTAKEKDDKDLTELKHKWDSRMTEYEAKKKDVDRLKIASGLK